jgi:hypothetical protein
VEENLRGSLSSNLAELIRREVPRMRQNVENRRAEVRKSLSELPAEVGNPLSKVSALSAALKDNLQAALMGSKLGSTLEYRAVLDVFEAFSKAVHVTQPVFKLESDAAQGSNVAATNGASDQRNEVFVAIDAYNSDQLVFFRTKTKQLGLRGRVALSMDEVVKFIKNNRGRELPVITPYRALVALILEFQKTWTNLGQDCFNEAAALVLKTAEAQVETQFKDCSPEVARYVKYASDVAPYIYSVHWACMLLEMGPYAFELVVCGCCMQQCRWSDRQAPECTSMVALVKCNDIPSLHVNCMAERRKQESTVSLPFVIAAVGIAWWLCSTLREMYSCTTTPGSGLSLAQPDPEGWLN